MEKMRRKGVKMFDKFEKMLDFKGLKAKSAMSHF